MRLSTSLKYGMLLSAALPFAACTSDNDPDGNGKQYPRKEISLDALQTRTCENITDKTLQLLAKYTKLYDSDENDALSPLSLWMAVDMSVNYGTEDDQAKFLDGVNPGGTMEQLNELNRKLLNELPEVDKSVQFSLANSYWEDINVEFRSGNFPKLEKYYDSEYFHVDFESAESGKLFNEWTSKHTNGRIDDMIPDGNPLAGSNIFVNAMYIKGKWTEKAEVDSKATSFMNADGSTTPVKMLKHSNFANGELDGHKIIYVPMGNGGYGFYAILPLEGESIEQCAQFLATKKLDDILALADKNIDINLNQVHFPPFEISVFNKNLEQLFMAMGITVQWTISMLDIYGIHDETIDPTISQNNYFKVDEYGAEAAAVTKIDYSIGIPPKNIVFDRPFIYMLAEKSTKTVMMMGSVRKL